MKCLPFQISVPFLPRPILLSLYKYSLLLRDAKPATFAFVNSLWYHGPWKHNVLICVLSREIFWCFVSQLMPKGNTPNAPTERVLPSYCVYSVLLALRSMLPLVELLTTLTLILKFMKWGLLAG